MHGMRMLVAAVGLTALIGCQPTEKKYPTHEPTETDPAMAMRQWDPSTAYYANGDTQAGHPWTGLPQTSKGAEVPPTHTAVSPLPPDKNPPVVAPMAAPAVVAAPLATPAPATQTWAPATSFSTTVPTTRPTTKPTTQAVAAPAAATPVTRPAAPSTLPATPAPTTAPTTKPAEWLGK